MGRVLSAMSAWGRLAAQGLVPDIIRQPPMGGWVVRQEVNCALKRRSSLSFRGSCAIVLHGMVEITGELHLFG